jgi:hypothetical protein
MSDVESFPTLDVHHPDSCKPHPKYIEHILRGARKLSPAEKQELSLRSVPRAVDWSRGMTANISHSHSPCRITPPPIGPRALGINGSSEWQIGRQARIQRPSESLKRLLLSSVCRAELHCFIGRVLYQFQFDPAAT